jgi:hypothetical protein
VLKSERGESFLSQMATGLETSALPGHEHEPLQQSLWGCQWGPHEVFKKINSPVAGGVSLAGSGLSSGNRGQTSGQGEESEALDGGRHAGRFFCFGLERIGVRVVGKLSWERRARVREAAVGRIYTYALHPSRAHFTKLAFVVAGRVDLRAKRQPSTHVFI